MATLAAITAGLAKALATTGLAVVTETDAVTLPCAVVRLGEVAVTYGTAGQHAYLLAPLVLVALPTTPLAYGALQPYLERSGVSSVAAAVADDPTLGGAAATATVTGARTVGLVGWGGANYLGAAFLVAVTA